MKIAVLGAGNIGRTLARRFAECGHEVRLSNSRDPNTILDQAAASGATAMRAADAVKGVDVVVAAVPFRAATSLSPVLSGAPVHAVIIDTSNYFPGRDGRIAAVEAGQAESEWVAERFGRPLVKAWNSVLQSSLATRNHPAGHPDRTALSVAGDDAAAKFLAMHLVELTGFDAVDGGTIADSWRQQPGSPAYTTELSRAALLEALAKADRASLPAKRDEMARQVVALNNDSVEDRLRIARDLFL